ncbi:MAG: [Fe-Fe] hydrogenase large subunit C-terminal domain-containing protein [Deltaproteobacteria bacterium]|nr:[Fe-Fe] hydrogenase large subunit C-terminal domain-containing protein [Deltaproteobacteria bacterium]
MSSSSEAERRRPHVQVDVDKCTGCVLCMKACPTKAIRVRKEAARIEGVCINCGECIRVCPKNAISLSGFKEDELNGDDRFVISPSTVIYSQFGSDYLPNDILLALKKMGFGYVHDQSYTTELFNFAIELYIREQRKKGDSHFPLISPVCPVVVSLIACRFPTLLKHIPPLATPREIVSREGKKRISTKYGYKPEDVRILNITPCPAMTDFVKESVNRKYAGMDKAVGINRVYEAVKRNLKEIDDDRVLHHSSGIGLGWGVSGGEVAGLDRNCLAVSGLDETILYLEKIEMGILDDLDYVECRVCREGCIGGPFTVEDKYRAKHLLQKFIRMFGSEKRIKYKYVIDLYKKGWFFTEKDRSQLIPADSGRSITENIERLNKVKQIMEALPRKECGMCGCPDCQTFAEDTIDGKTTLNHCMFLKNRPEKLKQLKSAI